MRYKKGAGSTAIKKRNKIMLRLIPYILVLVWILFLWEIKFESDAYYTSMSSNQRWTIAELDDYKDSDFREPMMFLLSDANCYYYQGEHTMPTAIGVYDMDGKLIWKSGGMICTQKNGKGIWVEIEKYLNDEKKQVIQQWFDKKYFDPAIHEMQYVESETGEYIPVSMDLGEFIPLDNDNGYRTASSGYIVDFSDTNGLRDSDYASLKVLRDINAVPYLIDDGPGSSNYKIYQDLYSEITDTREISTITPPNGVVTTSEYGVGFVDRVGRYFYSKYCTGEVELKIDGKLTPCFIYITSKADLVKSAFTDTDFRKTMAILLAIVAVVYAGIAVYYAGRKTIDVEEAKRTFVSASAHELKTPLSVIQNQAELILEDINPEKNKEYVASIYEEAERMKEIILSMQRYDRLSNMDGIEKTHFDLSELVSEELAKYQNAFDMRGIDLDVDLAQGAAIRGDRELVAMVVDNFLSNASKYATSPDGSNKPKVVVSVSPEGSRRKFSVFNTCEEIAGDELAKAWDMMYKIDKSRNREAGSPEGTAVGTKEKTSDGGGMGLPLAGRILEFHKYRYGSGTAEITQGGETLKGVEFWFVAR